MFTITNENQADIIEHLLELYRPDGANIIDFTYGTGAFWWNVYEKPRLKTFYKITACDAEPSFGKDRVEREILQEVLLSESGEEPEGEEEEHQHEENILKLDLTKDDYSHLGTFHIGVFDPPYLIGRPAFDYPSKYLSVLSQKVMVSFKHLLNGQSDKWIYTGVPLRPEIFQVNP